MIGNGKSCHGCEHTHAQVIIAFQCVTDKKHAQTLVKHKIAECELERPETCLVSTIQCQ